MDPVSQGVVGVIAAQQAANKKYLALATLCGVLGGMAPDLDVLIHSSSDPLLSLEFHRQFTHSLLFIPVGGLICALFIYFAVTKSRGMGFKQTYLFTTLGYASHGLLDACTTYGTLLFWPFSYERVAWNTISIIDPLFTLPLLFLVVMAVRKKKRLFSVIALGWLISYSALGIIQRERAEAVGWQLVEFRGHQATKLEAKPSFANILLWKVIYTTDTEYVVDAVRVGLSNTRIFPGTQVPKLDLARDFPWLDPDSQQAKDVERFRWFSNGYLSVSVDDPNVIVDMRYSILPHQVNGLWGITLNPQGAKEDHIEYSQLDRSGSFKELWHMLTVSGASNGGLKP